MLEDKFPPGALDEHLATVFLLSYLPSSKSNNIQTCFRYHKVMKGDSFLKEIMPEKQSNKLRLESFVLQSDGLRYQSA